jgi:hypothetical protein
MTQAKFARALRIPLATAQPGAEPRAPRPGSPLAFNLVARNPEAAFKALAA